MTDIEIANLALVGKLGCDPIATFEDDSAEGQCMLAQFANSKRAVLEAAAWLFAKDQVQLIQDPVPPLFKYQYKWVIPNNVLQVLDIYEDQFNRHDVWERNGRRVLTMRAPVYAEVIVRITSNDLMSGGFVEALATYLAWKSAITLTENRNLAADLKGQYLEALDEAKYIDGKQGSMEKRTTPRLPGRIR